jgi:hypothetical protein
VNAGEVSLRQYMPADQNDLVELWSVCGLLRPWNDPLEDIHLCLTMPSSELVVADSAGQLIGSAMLGHDGHRGWVYYLAVLPNWHRNGIGRSLMSYAEEWMDERQVPKIQAMIRADNLPVRGFYRRLGYQDGDVQMVEKFLNERSKSSA